MRLLSRIPEASIWAFQDFFRIPGVYCQFIAVGAAVLSHTSSFSATWSETAAGPKVMGLCPIFPPNSNLQVTVLTTMLYINYMASSQRTRKKPIFKPARALWCSFGHHRTHECVIATFDGTLCPFKLRCPNAIIFHYSSRKYFTDSLLCQMHWVFFSRAPLRLNSSSTEKRILFPFPPSFCYFGSFVLSNWNACTFNDRSLFLSVATSSSRFLSFKLPVMINMNECCASAYQSTFEE